MKDIVAIVLAAGRGTRMKSGTPKVLHEILGRAMIAHVISSLKKAGVKDIITVIGHGSEGVKKILTGMKTVTQKRLLGSGDAVLCARKMLDKPAQDVLVICGDTPLVRPDTIKRLIAKYKESGSSAVVLTAKVKDPTGYGRIIRDGGGMVSKIVEDLEASLYEEVVDEINAGTYCFKAGDLFEALSQVKPDNVKKEIFLTDAIGFLYAKGKKVEAVAAEDPEEGKGINDRADLASVTNFMKKKILAGLEASGVTIEDPSSTTIYPGAKIGRDTIIHPNTLIENDVVIGERCHIGPFARIRPDVTIGDGAEIGNFVELVRTSIGRRTKVKHHTYLGDASVGKDANIGAGTITANYDGKSKNRTVIKDRAFIGVGAILIAPVKIGKGAVVGAGAVIPKRRNVPSGATVIGIPARIFRKK
jgi:bifunctional UDP-N-acetylglucosamine pyrophosphorylase / glucosamine-1-phosphate N-acetyltransferase